MFTLSELFCSRCYVEGRYGEVEMALEAALELQEKADFEMESVNPHCDYMYEEVLCCQFTRNDVHGDNVNVVDADSCSDDDSMISGSFLDSEVIQLATLLNQG
ncbi:hypothetical protein PTKIN_Ptkin15bG0179600 [Pterospermum kingtungense]